MYAGICIIEKALVVADHDNGAVFFEAAQNMQKFFGIFGVKGGGGFVQQKYLRFQGKAKSQIYPVPFAAGKFLTEACGIFFQTQF